MNCKANIRSNLRSPKPAPSASKNALSLPSSFEATSPRMLLAPQYFFCCELCWTTATFFPMRTHRSACRVDARRRRQDVNAEAAKKLFFRSNLPSSHILRIRLDVWSNYFGTSSPSIRFIAFLWSGFVLPQTSLAHPRAHREKTTVAYFLTAHVIELFKFGFVGGSKSRRPCRQSTPSPGARQPRIPANRIRAKRSITLVLDTRTRFDKDSLKAV